MNAVNGYPLEYNEQPESHRFDDSDTSPFEQLYWQGEPVWMPDMETVKRWVYDSVCESLDGHTVQWVLLELQWDNGRVYQYGISPEGDSHT